MSEKPDPCPKCNGSGFIAIRSRDGSYAFPGPVPDDTRGYAEAKCLECGTTRNEQTEADAMSALNDLLPCPFCGGSDIMTMPPTCKRDSPRDDADRAFPVACCMSCSAEAIGENWDATCDSAIAAWNRRAGGEGWSADMETAPRDGTKFDVWMGRDGYRICDVYWSDIQGWWSTDGAYGPEEPTPLVAYPLPTHWRPLPAAPGDAG